MTGKYRFINSLSYSPFALTYFPAAISPDFEQHYSLIHQKKKVLGLLVPQSRVPIAIRMRSFMHQMNTLQSCGRFRAADGLRFFLVKRNKFLNVASFICPKKTSFKG